MSFAPFTDKIIDNGFGSSRNGASINGIVVHHVAGTDGKMYVATANSRNSHPTYHIARDGTLTGIVNPDRRPSSTGGKIDAEAVTVEIANSVAGGQWLISDASFNTLRRVTEYHAAASNRAGIALNVPGKAQTEFFVAWHSQYVNTACPGPYVRSKLPELVTGAIPLSTDTSVPVSVPEPVVGEWSYWEPNHTGVARRVQAALKAKGRYHGLVDDVFGPLTRKAVQETLNFSNCFLGFEDGIIEAGGCYGIQLYAKKFGDYIGPLDSKLGINSWIGFALGLERP